MTANTHLRVEAVGIPVRLYALAAAPDSQELPLLFRPLQVLYKKNRHSHPSIMETNTTSVELALPTDEDYIVQIKPFGEGGDGNSSRQITIPRIPGEQSCWLALCAFTAAATEKNPENTEVLPGVASSSSPSSSRPPWELRASPRAAPCCLAGCSPGHSLLYFLDRP